MFSVTFAVLCFITIFAGVGSIMVYSDHNNGIYLGLVSLLSFVILMFSLFDHPSPIEVIQEKVIIVDGKAMSASCLNLNVDIGKNLKDGDTVYRIEKLPYWHRGMYWFKDGLKKYEFSLTNPNAPSKNINNNGQIIAIDGLPLEAFEFKRKDK